MTVAAALEYMYHRPSPHHHEVAHEDEHSEHGARGSSRDLDHGHDYDADDDHAHKTDQDHDEASADWLENQGFDRKE